MKMRNKVLYSAFIFYISFFSTNADAKQPAESYVAPISMSKMETIGPAQKLGKQLDESIQRSKEQLQRLTAPGGPLDQTTQKIQEGMQRAINSLNKALQNKKQENKN